MKKQIRILSTIIAISLGIGIVILLSLAGGRTRGPLENALSFTTNLFRRVESSLFIEQRELRRADALAWFLSLRTNPVALKNPGLILLGAFDNQTTESLESIITLEDSLRTTFPLIHIYTAWGSKPEEQFPASEVGGILALGSLPVITWEPWLTDFDAVQYPHLRPTDERSKGGLADVARGEYDDYLKRWAAEAREVLLPVFIRLGHEMNDPYRYPWGPQNNTAVDFIAAWRHVHNIFKEAGAGNIIWIWSPHPAYGYFDAYYPGNEYVDYVGVGALNYGTAASWSKWWTFKEIFGDHYIKLAAFHKPIMITELGCLAVGGSRNQWFDEAFSHLQETYPAIKSILFFHCSTDQTTTQQTLDWYFKDDTLTTHAVTRHIRTWATSGLSAPRSNPP